MPQCFIFDFTCSSVRALHRRERYWRYCATTSIRQGRSRPGISPLNRADANAMNKFHSSTYLMTVAGSTPHPRGSAGPAQHHTNCRYTTSCARPVLRLALYPPPAHRSGATAAVLMARTSSTTCGKEHLDRAPPRRAHPTIRASPCARTG